MRLCNTDSQTNCCENEVNGPTQQAIDWINQVRERANLKDLYVLQSEA